MPLIDDSTQAQFVTRNSDCSGDLEQETDPASLFDTVTRGFGGDSCSVVTQDILYGARVDAQHVPFISVEFTSDGTTVDLWLGDSRQPSTLRRTVIENVTSAVLSRNRLKGRVVLQINHGTAQTIVHFHRTDDL